MALRSTDAPFPPRRAPTPVRVMAAPTAEATLWTLVIDAYELLGQPSLWLAQELLDAAVAGAITALDEIGRTEGGRPRG